MWLLIKRYWRPAALAICGIGVIGAVAWWFWKIQARNPVAVPVKAQPDPKIELRFHQVELKGRKDGTPNWEIKADQMEVSRDQRFAYFKGEPKGRFFNLKDWSGKPEGEQKSRSFEWNAKQATYDSVDENLTIEGKVHIVTDAKDTLDTEIIRWLSKEQKIYIDKPLKVVGSNKTPKIEAQKATADVKLEIIEFEGQVKIETVVKEQDQL